MGETEQDGTIGSRTIGFLPSYLPDSTDSGEDFQSHGTVLPPYPSDLSSYGQDPPPYSPSGLSGFGKNTDSYNPDESYDTEPPPYPSESTDEDGTTIPPWKGFHHSIPSAPSVDQIDYRIGLTQIERQVILNALSNMRANALWKTQEEKNNFSHAEDEVLELLHGVQSRLTNSEKEEFLIEVRKINQMRNEDETGRQNFADFSPKWCGEPVTIGLKIIEVAMSIVIFFTIQEPKKSLDRRLALLYFELIGILATCFTISYWCNPKQSRTVRILDSIFCIFSTVGCGFAGGFASEHGTGTYSFWTMIVYGLDTLWKLCQKGICYD